jgi:hypothetical protein
MTTQQFFKGLMMMLVTVIVSAFSQQPIDYLLLAVTAVSTILTYSGKNLIAVLHSDSPVGSLSWINLASGLLVALGAGILESVGLYLIEGAILWNIVWKVVLASAFTYLGTTFFAPQHSTAKVRGFISPAASRSLRKASMMLVLLFAIGIGASAQSQWIGFKGFFRSTEPANLEKYVGSVELSPGVKALSSGVWQARFNAGMEAVALYPKLDEAGKLIGLDPRDFTSFIFGVFFTHAKPDGFQDWSAGPFVALPNIAAGYERYGIGVAGAYSVFKVGLKYDVGLPLKQGLCLMTGIKIDLFNQIN